MRNPAYRGSALPRAPPPRNRRRPRRRRAGRPSRHARSPRRAPPAPGSRRARSCAPGGRAAAAAPRWRAPRKPPPPVTRTLTRRRVERASARCPAIPRQVANRNQQMSRLAGRVTSSAAVPNGVMLSANASQVQSANISLRRMPVTSSSQCGAVRQRGSARICSTENATQMAPVRRNSPCGSTNSASCRSRNQNCGSRNAPTATSRSKITSDHSTASTSRPRTSAHGGWVGSSVSPERTQLGFRCGPASSDQYTPVRGVPARGEFPSAFERRFIPADCVVPRSLMLVCARSSRLAHRARPRSRCDAGWLRAAPVRCTCTERRERTGHTDARRGRFRWGGIEYLRYVRMGIARRT